MADNVRNMQREGQRNNEGETKDEDEENEEKNKKRSAIVAENLVWHHLL
jgi:hypothetical protein